MNNCLNILREAAVRVLRPAILCCLVGILITVPGCLEAMLISSLAKAPPKGVDRVPVGLEAPPVEGYEGLYDAPVPLRAAFHVPGEVKDVKVQARIDETKPIPVEAQLDLGELVESYGVAYLTRAFVRFVTVTRPGQAEDCDIVIHAPELMFNVTEIKQFRRKWLRHDLLLSLVVTTAKGKRLIERRVQKSLLVPVKPEPSEKNLTLASQLLPTLAAAYLDLVDEIHQKSPSWGIKPTDTPTPPKRSRRIGEITPPVGSARPAPGGAR